MTSHERCGRQIEVQVAIHPFVEVEIEVVEAHLRIAKLCLFPAPFQQSIAATSQLVRLESHGAGIFDRRHTVFLQQGKHPQDAADAGLSLPSYMADKSESKIIFPNKKLDRVRAA